MEGSVMTASPSLATATEELESLKDYDLAGQLEECQERCAVFAEELAAARQRITKLEAALGGDPDQTARPEEREEVYDSILED